MTTSYISAVSVLVASFIAATASPLAGAALGGTAAANIGLLAAHVRPESNHPLRMIGPVLVMGLAYLEMHDPASPRAYSVARLVFSLAFAAEFAPLIFELWGDWPLPILTILVCLGVVFYGIAPERWLKWLHS